MVHDPIPVERIGVDPIPIAISLEEGARDAVAKRLGLQALDALEVDGSVRRRRDTGWIEFKGRLIARVVQDCVVSLEPVEADLDVPFVELFDDQPDDGTTEIDIDVDPTGDDPEPIHGASLDVGDVVIQTLAVSLDPYPRRADVSELDVADGKAGEPAETTDAGSPGENGNPDSPFAKLAVLKDRTVKKR